MNKEPKLDPVWAVVALVILVCYVVYLYGAYADCAARGGVLTHSLQCAARVPEVLDVRR